MPPPVPIIVGVPRSGTTLLRMMLDAHPAVAIPPETGFLPPLAALDPTRDAARDAWHIITSFPTWPDFCLDAALLRRTFDALSPVSPAAAARAFYQLYAARFRKARWGDKTPTYSAELPAIAALLPEARFIHLIRDGRDVMLSVRGLWFSPGASVEACAADWAARLAQTRALSAQVPSYLEVRYESLVERPEQTLREVCEFVDLEFDRQMLSYHLRAAARLDEHQARHAADGSEIISKEQRLYNQRLVNEAPRRDRIGRWQMLMTAEDVRRFEAVGGDWLARLGYRLSSQAV